MNHGHVTPNPDGSKARCGGPPICPICAVELAQKTQRLEELARLAKRFDGYAEAEKVDVIIAERLATSPITPETVHDWRTFLRVMNSSINALAECIYK